MPEERYYIDHPLKANTAILLRDGEHRHLVQVMRAKVGGKVEIINGNGELAEATVEEIRKKESQLKILSVEKEAESSNKLILAQAITRTNRLDTIIEKVTELGVTEVWLFPGLKSERRELTEHQLERLRHITIAAIKQSGRLWLPKIQLVPKVSDWKEISHPIIFGELNSKTSIQQIPKSNHCMLVIGPESGLTTTEEEHLRQLKATGITLHDNILRTDTAAISGITLLYHHLRH